MNAHARHEAETELQFADRFAGAWRAVILSQDFGRHAYYMVEDVLRVALQVADTDANAKELLSRARKIAGPNVNGARLLTEIDDFLLSIEGRNLGVWKIISDGTAHRDDFAFWRVEDADYSAEPEPEQVVLLVAEQVPVPDAPQEQVEQVRIEPSPLETLARAWFNFAAAAETGAQTAGGMLNAVRTRTESLRLVALGDELLTAIAACAPSDNDAHNVKANKLSKFLSKSAGQPVEVVAEDGETRMLAFELIPHRDPDIRRWLLVPR